MLRVELDIYSGMPNPSWVLTEQEERELLDRIVAQPTLMQPPDAAPEVLGYRGFMVSVEKQDDGPWSKAAAALAGEMDLQDNESAGKGLLPAASILLPSAFRIGNIGDAPQLGTEPNEGADTSMWLLNTSEKPDTTVDDFLRGVAQGAIDLQALAFAADAPAAEVEPAGPGMLCSSNYYTGTNFTIWNTSPYISMNNCYCFGSNHRANHRYASPGKRSLGYFPGLSYNQMRYGLLADGWRDSCRAARNLSLACVVWPGRDFHFYRKVTSSGIWGHKAGSTRARTTDNAGRTIYNPYYCSRGSYTTWIGYFYQDNNTAFVA